MSAIIPRNPSAEFMEKRTRNRQCRSADKTRAIIEKFTVKDANGCWLWQRSKYRCGYGHMTYQKQSTAAHRVSFMVHRGEIPNGLCVLHKCDVRACVNPDHLFIGDKGDNFRDAIQKGRWIRPRAKKGTQCKHAHLTDETLTVARALLEDGMRVADVARKIGVNYTVIWYLKQGRSYRE